MSVKRRVAEKLLAPVVAAGASLAARYAVKKGPELVENTLLPWLRQATASTGGVAEKIPETARAAASSGGDLAERLTDRAREATGGGSGGESDKSGSRRRRAISTDELSERSEERAKRREQRRKATKGR